MLVSQRLVSAGPRRLFSVLQGTTHLNSNLPPFMVGVDNGFLPRQEPLVALPSTFTKLEELLQRMPIKLLDGRPGLLQTGDFGKAIDSELPVYDVDGIHDQRLLTGLAFASDTYNCVKSLIFRAHFSQPSSVITHSRRRLTCLSLVTLLLEREGRLLGVQDSLQVLPFLSQRCRPRLVPSLLWSMRNRIPCTTTDEKIWQKDSSTQTWTLFERSLDRSLSMASF
jgi:hypothetical protein